MLEQLQKDINRWIERFQDRWETDSSFRAVWSTIGGAAVLIFLCGTMFAVQSSANALINPKATQQPTAPISNAGAGSANVSFPIPTFQKGTDGNQPGGNPVAAASAPTPTATIPPTPIGATPTTTPNATTTATASKTPTSGTPGATPTGGFVVVAAQQPNPWHNAADNAITNIITAPSKANATMAIHLDFGNGCSSDLPGVTLDDKGRLAQTPGFSYPACFTQKGLTQVTATFTIGGQAATLQFQANQ